MGEHKLPLFENKVRNIFRRDKVKAEFTLTNSFVICARHLA
jgi:hypothetical protein